MESSVYCNAETNISINYQNTKIKLQKTIKIYQNKLSKITENQNFKNPVKYFYWSLTDILKQFEKGV